jgi:hypothetical protein
VRRSIGTTRSLNSRADAAAGGSLGPLGKKPPLPPGKKSRACREEASRLPGRSRRARWGRSLAPAHRLGPSSSPSPAPSLPATWGLCPSPTLSLSPAAVLGAPPRPAAPLRLLPAAVASTPRRSLPATISSSSTREQHRPFPFEERGIANAHHCSEHGPICH